MIKHAPFAIRSTKLGLPKGIQPGILFIENGLISNILPYEQIPTGIELHELGSLFVFPGLIDCHVHINEPGRSDWEGFDSATRAAAAGGITSLVDMPLNSSPVTINAAELKNKIKASSGKLNVNCGFWGGVIPGNTADLDELLSAGALGLKAFLSHSGIDEFPNASEEDLRKALLILKDHHKPLLVHCEIEAAEPAFEELQKSPRSYQAWLNSRPDQWELNAIEMLIRLCRETGGHAHIVHLATQEALPMIRAAKAEGLPLTVETCPHYLVFESEEIGEGQTQFKCAPPIRGKVTREGLWAAVKDGTFDFIVSDHSPAPPDIKSLDSGDFSKAWGGIAGLQFSFPAFWTEASKRGFSPEIIRTLFAEGPAKFCGYESQKGSLQVGFDADIMVWNPEEEWTVKSEDVLHRHKLSPYVGMKMRGKVHQTFVGGELVFDSGRFLHLAQGKVLVK